MLNYDKAFILISHDTEFLNSVVNVIYHWDLIFNKLNEKIQHNYEKVKKSVDAIINASNGMQQTQKE